KVNRETRLNPNSTSTFGLCWWSWPACFWPRSSFVGATREANLVMVFLAGVTWVAFRFGRGPAIVASVAAVLMFDFCFVPPYFTFAVGDTEYLLTFVVMLAIGLIIGTLTARLKEQVAHARLRQRGTAAQYELSRQLSSLSGSEFLVIAAGRKIEAIFDAEVAIYLVHSPAPPELRYGQQTSIPKQPINAIVAQWVAEHDQMAGVGTDTLPNATALFFPLIGSQRTLGALAIKTGDTARLLAPEQRQLLEACTSQLALALERDQMTVAAHEAQVQAEAEHLRELAPEQRFARSPHATGCDRRRQQQPAREPRVSRKYPPRIANDHRR
ncbi:MAG: DUF4118 domain-containing protein, partial [Thermomicrobiales bacterium]